MINKGLRYIALVFGLLFIKCSSNQSNIVKNKSCSLVGTYYHTYKFTDAYEYVELQFTPEGYLLYYLNKEGIGHVSVYKLDSDSTFFRWWVYGETEYRFYRSNDTLFLQLVDSTRQTQYKPYVKIDPEITLQKSFASDQLRDDYYEEAWSRFQLYTP